MDAASAKVFPLLDLPRELRDYVYYCCLAVGKVNPYLETHRSEARTDIIQYNAYSDDAPNTALLLVNRQIHQEAEIFLYKWNMFVLPAFGLAAKFLGNSLATSIRRSWLKSMELDLDPSDLTTEDRRVVCDSRLGRHKQLEQNMYYRTQYPTASEYLRLCGKDLHEANKRYLVDVSWPRKLAPILEYLRLDNLIVNIDCSTCEDICCILYAGALMAFREGFALAVPRSLKIFGLFEATLASYFETEDYDRDKSWMGEDGSENSIDQYQPPDAVVSNMIKQWSWNRGCPGFDAELFRSLDGEDDAWMEVVESEI